MISSITSFEIINVVTTDAKVFVCICVPVADTACVTPPPQLHAKLLASVVSAFLIDGNPNLINEPRALLRNPNF